MLSIISQHLAVVQYSKITETPFSHSPGHPTFRGTRRRSQSGEAAAAAMAAPPVRSRHLSPTIFRSIHGLCRRHLSSSLSLPPPPRRRSSHSETKNPRNEKKQELSRQGLAILSFVSLLNSGNIDNPCIRL